MRASIRVGPSPRRARAAASAVAGWAESLSAGELAVADLYACADVAAGSSEFAGRVGALLADTAMPACVRRVVVGATAPGTAWETTARSTGATVANQMGGVDPRTDKYWFGGFVTGSGDKFSFTSYDPDGNKIAATAITVTALTPPGGNGDLAFDRLGNMYFISSSAGNAQIYRVDAADLSGTTTTATAVAGATHMDA